MIWYDWYDTWYMVWYHPYRVVLIHVVFVGDLYDWLIGYWDAERRQVTDSISKRIRVVGCLGYAQVVFEALAEFSVDELKKMFGTEMDPWFPFSTGNYCI